MSTPKRRPSVVAETAARITALEARQADLERRIAELEQAAVRQMPWVPTFPQTTPVWLPTQPSTPWAGSHCPQCGVEWKGSMGYVCPSISCPMGAGPVWCGTPPGDETTCRPPLTIAAPGVAVGETPAHLTYPALAAETPEHLKGATAYLKDLPPIAHDVFPPRRGDSVYGR